MSSDSPLPPEPPEQEPAESSAVEPEQPDSDDVDSDGVDGESTPDAESSLPEDEIEVIADGPEASQNGDETGDSDTAGDEAGDEAIEGSQPPEEGKVIAGEETIGAASVAQAEGAAASTAEEPPGIEIEFVEPGWIRRSLAWVLRLVVTVLNWLIVELEAEDVRQRPGAPNSLGARLSLTEAELDRLTPLRRFWQRVLLGVRSLLPQKLQEVSDRNLGIILATLFVVVGWTAVDGILPKPAPVPEQAIAQVPPEPPIPTPPELEEPPAPQLPDVVEIEPPPENAIAIEDERDIDDGDGAIAEAPELDADNGDDGDDNGIGDEAVALDDEVPTAPTQPPVLELTPEQSLIAAIQDQVVATTERYSESGIVRSIQADFRQSRLLVRINPDPWFTLTAAEQDRLAADLWSRSLNLDFNQLEITTVDGVSLARSPVVGNTMVILKRQSITL